MCLHKDSLHFYSITKIVCKKIYLKKCSINRLNMKFKFQEFFEYLRCMYERVNTLIQLRLFINLKTDI